MKTSIALLPPALFALPAVFAACASVGEPAASSAPSALETLRAGGDFAFVLGESSPAAAFHASCAADHPGDAASADACYAAVRETASHEGFRFSVDGRDRLFWTSYGRESGQPATYAEGPMNARLGRPASVVAATFAERPRGLQMDGQDLDMRKVLRFQVVDADTVVTVDPRKGKLVFRRAPAAG